MAELGRRDAHGDGRSGDLEANRKCEEACSPNKKLRFETEIAATRTTEQVVSKYPNQLRRGPSGVAAMTSALQWELILAKNYCQHQHQACSFLESTKLSHSQCARSHRSLLV